MKTSRLGIAEKDTCKVSVHCFGAWVLSSVDPVAEGIEKLWDRSDNDNHPDDPSPEPFDRMVTVALS